MAKENNDMKQWGNISLLLFFLGILFGLFNFFIYSGKYSILIILMSFAVLFSSIGMRRPEYSRFSKYMSGFFLSASAFSLYITTNNQYYAILAILYMLVITADDLKSSK